MKSSAIKICSNIISILSKNKGSKITKIDLKGKTSIADFMIICSGTSSRHIIALSNYLSKDLKKIELKTFNIEGTQGGDWILVDAGDVIVHLFRNEVREYYNLEKMWKPKISDDMQINN